MLQTATILPLLWAFERLSKLWQLPIGLLYLPIIMLSMAVHRVPGSMTPERAGITWPSESLRIRGHGGIELTALHFAHEAPKGLVLLVHGIGAEKCQFIPALRPFYEAGFDVYTYDQRNHGESGGYATTLGVREAPDLLELDGLVLDSTFARLAPVAESRLPFLGPLLLPLLSGLRLDVCCAGVRMLGLEPVRDAERPRETPVLVLHASDDPMIDVAHARELASAYGGDAHLHIYGSERHAVGFVDSPARLS